VHSDFGDVRRTRAVAAVLLLGLTASVVINWPGHINYDSTVQLAEGRAGLYQNWHPALMSWMLGVGDKAVPGVCLFTLFDTLTLYGAALSLCGLANSPLRLAPLVAVAFVLTPQFAIYPGIAWKDVLFAAAAVAAFVCIAHAAARWREPIWRAGLVALALAFTVIAVLVRQNGAVIAIFVAAAIGWIAARHQSARVAAGVGLAALAVIAAAALLIFVGLSRQFTPGYDAVADQIKQLRVFDIVNAVSRRPGLKLDVIRADNPLFEKLIRTRGVQVNRPYSHDLLMDDPVFGRVADRAPDEVVRRQWYDFVRRHPMLYLQVRAEVFRWIVMTPDPDSCSPLEVGVFGPSDAVQTLGLAYRHDQRDAALVDYGIRLSRTPVLSHLTYFLIGCGVLAFLFRRRRASDLAIAMMVLSSFVFAASFFAISFACDYRYLLFVDLSAMTACLYVVLTARAKRQGDAAA